MAARASSEPRPFVVVEQIRAGAHSAGQPAPVAVTPARYQAVVSPGRFDAKHGSGAWWEALLEWDIYTTAQGGIESHGLSLNGVPEPMGRAVAGGS